VVGRPNLPDQPDAGEGEVQFTYSYGFTKPFRFDEGKEALQQLINSTISIRVHESSNGNVLGSAVVDMLPFAMGKQQIELKSVELEAAPVPEEQTQVCEGS
jgi:hypothetical protein